MSIYLENPLPWLASVKLWAGVRAYDGVAKAYLRRSGHYLEGPPAGAFMAIGVERLGPSLFPGHDVPDGLLIGLVVVGRPVARNLPQDGRWGELTRVVLDPGLPHETASHVLRVAVEAFSARRGSECSISYHDRTRHSGCIYKKAGFRKDGVTRAGTRRGTWASRSGRDQAAESEVASKRRWRIDLDAVRAAVAVRGTITECTYPSSDCLPFSSA